MHATRGNGQNDDAARPAVAWVDGTIRLVDDRLFDRKRPGACRKFLARIFRLSEIRSLEIDFIARQAVIQYDVTSRTAAEVLARLATVMRGGSVADAVATDEPPPWPSANQPTIKIFRHGSLLSTWEILSDLPGRIRFRSEDLTTNRDLAARAEAELTSAHGVTDVRIRPLTGSLLVQFESRAITPRHLLHLLERLRLETGEIAHASTHPPPVRFGLVNASVGLAALGTFALPILLPASAILLLASNRTVIKAAWRDLRRRHLSLPVLFSTIIAGTLASGDFLTASIMAWMVVFWRHQHRVAQFQLRRQLLAPLAQRPRFARICAGARHVELPIERLRAGDRIHVEPGELIPADGRLIDGPAVVDERLVCGTTGLTLKQAGDPIFAGSCSVDGALEIEVSELAHAPRAARIARELAAAAVHLPTGLSVTPHGERFGQRAVPTTLAAAGIGLLVGDLTMATAILRPDYSTGPGMGVSLESLRDIASGAGHGVVIRDASALERIASADLILFDHVPALEQAGIKVAGVESLDGTPEAEILRLCATAFRDLGDERAFALRKACARNQIEPLDVVPGYRGEGITFEHGPARISVREAPGPEASGATARPLEVRCDGRLAGIVTFGFAVEPHALDAIQELKRQDALPIGLISDRADDDARALAAALGIELHAVGITSESKRHLLASLRQRGLKAIYVGDCRRHPDVAREAFLAISVTEEFDPDNDPAAVLVLRRDLGWLGPLRSLARSHIDRIRAVHGAVLLPNAACIAGAFLLGFTSLSAVVLTNLGTLAIFSGLPRRLGDKGVRNLYGPHVQAGDKSVKSNKGVRNL